MPQGNAGGQFNCQYKINANYHGFNFKAGFANIDVATAVQRATTLASYLKALMPTDSEIFYASVSSNNTKRDGKYVPSALGAGSYGGGGGPPAPTHPDFDRACVEIRLESDDGFVIRKVCPIPDEVVTQSELVQAVAPVLVKPAVPPLAPDTGVTWYDKFNLLMQALVYYTHHIKSGAAPGGPFTYFDWTAAYVTKVGTKKGARIFN